MRRRQELCYALTMKLNETQRRAVEHIADTQEVTLGQAARHVLMAGFKALNIEV